MKQYEVRMAMTVSVTVEVEAENQEQAEKLAIEKTEREEAFYLAQYDSVWEREVTEVNECEEDSDDDVPEKIKKALKYVRSQLKPEDLTLLRAHVDKAYVEHGNYTDDDEKVIDLLEEYGDDNDLPEGWWEEYGDIDHWMVWI